MSQLLLIPNKEATITSCCREKEVTAGAYGTWEQDPVCDLHFLQMPKDVLGCSGNNGTFCTSIFGTESTNHLGHTMQSFKTEEKRFETSVVSHLNQTAPFRPWPIGFLVWAQLIARTGLLQELWLNFIIKKKKKIEERNPAMISVEIISKFFCSYYISWPRSITSLKH